MEFAITNLISFAFGKIASIPIPKRLRTPLFRLYSGLFGVRYWEAERPLSEYQSLSEFFVRRIKRSARPISGKLVSPVDGHVMYSFQIHNGVALQVKGRRYSVSNLLQSEELAASFDGGFGISIYLGPGDYHRIHSPVEGKVLKSILVPGALLPVGKITSSLVNELYLRCERIVSIIESKAHGLLAVVKVGAINVGSISLSYDKSLKSNCSPWKQRDVKQKDYPGGIAVNCGDELGCFNLGSTVVLLVSKTFGELDVFKSGDSLQVGQSLGGVMPNYMGPEKSISQ